MKEGGREGGGGGEEGEREGGSGGKEGGEMKKGVGEEGREKQLLASQKMGELLRDGGLGERGSEREAGK